MMSYPLEKDKGKMFGIFWGMLQFICDTDIQFLILY